MPATKDTKQTYNRSYSNNDMTMSAKVYHPATNLMPPTPPLSPVGMGPAGFLRPANSNAYSRQNSHAKS